MRVEVELGVCRNEEHDYKRQRVLEDMKMCLLVKVVVVHEGGGKWMEWKLVYSDKHHSAFDLFWLGNKLWIM